MTDAFPTALGAEFSPDRTHRFLLWRLWDDAPRHPLFTAYDVRLQPFI